MHKCLVAFAESTRYKKVAVGCTQVLGCFYLEAMRCPRLLCGLGKDSQDNVSERAVPEVGCHCFHIMRDNNFVAEQAAVDRMLVVHAPNASAEARQQHLKLLVEVYKRTHALAEQLQVLVPAILFVPWLPCITHDGSNYSFLLFT